MADGMAKGRDRGASQRAARSRTGPVGGLPRAVEPRARDTEPRAPRIEEDARRRTPPSPTRWLRFVLPLAALGLMAFVFTSNRPGVAGLELPIASGEILALQSGMRVTNPRFTGATSAGEPFLIRADHAQPDGPDPNRIELSKIVGSITTEEGRKVGLTSAAGVLEPKLNAVTLSDGVRIVTDDGYVFETATLQGDAEGRKIWSETPVRGYGPAGEITAKTLEIDIAGDGVAYFEGDVRVTIRQLVERETE